MLNAFEIACGLLVPQEENSISPPYILHREWGLCSIGKSRESVVYTQHFSVPHTSWYPPIALYLHLAEIVCFPVGFETYPLMHCQ